MVKWPKEEKVLIVENEFDAKWCVACALSNYTTHALTGQVELDYHLSLHKAYDELEVPKV